jgi:hypothetical protein
MIPYFELNLGGRIYKLRCGMGAMLAYEQLTGKKIMDMEEDISIETTAQLLWAMLRQEEKDITLDEAMKLVDDNADNIIEVMQAVTKAIQMAFTGGKIPNVKTPTAKKLS